jgi:4-amino-4-deoxy-L-arabinose transferase-like glycosyltransferase
MGGDMVDTKGIIILSSIILLAIILSYILYSGPFVYYDDNYYILSAHQMLQGTFTPNGIPFTVETLTIASIALSFLLFGYGIVQAALPSLVEYLATIIVIFLLGRKMLNDYFAGIASFLFATAPFVLGYTTRALPDMLTGLTVAIACYYLYKAINLKSNRAMLLVGFFIALTMLVKTAGVIIIASFLIGLVYLYADKNFRKNKRMFVYAIVGMLIPLLIMMLYFYILTGNPFFNLHVYTIAFVNIAPTTLSNNINALSISVNPIYLLHIQGWQQIAPHTFPMGLIIVFAFIGAIIGIAKKNKVIIFFSLITLIPMLYIFFGTKSLSQYVPISVVSRYIEIIAAPIAILAAYALSALYNSVKKEGKAAAAFVIIIIVLFATFINFATYTSQYSYNLGIRSYNIIYPMLLHNIVEANASKIYMLSELPSLNSQYLTFISGFSGVNFSSVGPVCTPNYYNTMLINSFNNFDAEQSNSTIASWLGSNCSLAKIASYKVITGPSLYTEGELFKIAPH